MSPSETIVRNHLKLTESLLPFLLHHHLMNVAKNKNKMMKISHHLTLHFTFLHHFQDFQIEICSNSQMRVVILSIRRMHKLIRKSQRQLAMRQFIDFVDSRRQQFFSCSYPIYKIFQRYRCQLFSLHPHKILVPSRLE